MKLFFNSKNEEKTFQLVSLLMGFCCIIFFTGYVNAFRRVLRKTNSFGNRAGLKWAEQLRNH